MSVFTDKEIEYLRSQRLAAFADRPFVFNLGHGVLPDTPIAHVERMLVRVRRN